jgi:hypothetical protein
MEKKRTINEYRQVKDNVYHQPTQNTTTETLSTADITIEIRKMLDVSKNEHLTAEVVAFGLKFMKEDPSLTEIEAMKYAMNECNI